MPELPEVEVTRRSFAQAITGGDILDVRMGKPLRWPLGCGVADLCGRRIESVGRRGKYLLLHITDGVLLIHLGMSGSLAFTPPGRLLGAPAAHDHFDMSTHRGHLRLTDPRRFGAVVFAQSLDAPIAHKLLGHLGVEPLGDDFDVDVFVAAMRKRRAPIKQALLAGMWSLAWVTFTRLRPCSLQAYTQRAPLAMWRCHASRPCIRSSGCCWRRRFRWAAQPSRTLKTHRESTACFKTRLRCMGERPRPAKCVPEPLDALYKDSAQRITAWGASGERHAAWS